MTGQDRTPAEKAAYIQAGRDVLAGFLETIMEEPFPDDYSQQQALLMLKGGREVFDDLAARWGVPQ